MPSTESETDTTAALGPLGQRDHALFRALIRTTKDGVLALDAQGTVLIYNDAAARLFLHAPEAVLGSSVDQLLAPAYRSELTGLLAKADARGHALTPFTATLEVQGLRKDGTLLPLQISLGDGVLEDGRVFVAVIHDLTPLHRERIAHDEEKAYAALIIDSVNDAIISYMLDGTVRSWNRAAEKMFGYTAAEIIGANALTLIPLFVPQAVRDGEKAIFVKALAGETVPPHESVRLHKNGSSIPVQISASAIRDAQGRVIGISRALRDLREQRAHQHARALLDSATNSSDDTFTCVGLDGTILTWNRGAEHMLGYAASEVVGKKAPGFIEKVVPQDMIASELEKNRRATTGETIGPYRTTRIHKNGTLVPVMSTVAPVRSEDGKVLAISRTLQDLTERMAFEQQRALLSSIVESSNDAVFSKTLDGIVTSWNGGAEQMFGYKAEEIIGQPVALIIPPERLEEADKTLAAIGEGRSLRHFETLRCKKDGTVFDVSISIAPLRDSNGTVTGASATIRDISERKEYERRLQVMREDMIHVARVQELGQVSAGIAHELNQPLAAMLNYSNAAIRIAGSQDSDAITKLPEVTAKIGAQAERAAEIIRRMRDFVEKRDPHRALIDINAIADDALALALIGTKSANITTHVQRAPCTAVVLADRVQIQQVLVNLLCNAAEAMATSPRRELTLTITCQDDGSVEVAVKDTGTGIPAHVAQQLFAPFVTTKAQGMGIGLAISKSIIDAHGGSMHAEPNPGGGTIFRFTLPTSCKAPDSAPQISA